MSTTEDKEYVKRKRIVSRYSIRYFASYSWRRIKKVYPQYTREDISRCITTYLELAQEDLALGTKIHFLNKLGSLYLQKDKREVTYNIETGKILNTLPVNIYDSLKLWKQKPELRNKTFVRFTNDHSNGYLFRFRYETSKAMFKNKKVYSFKFSRTLKGKLVKNIRDKKVDAFIIPNMEHQE